MSTEIVNAPQTAIAGPAQRPTLVQFFQKNLAGQLAMALPRHLTPDRMTRVVLTAVRTVPNLGKCSQESFAGAVMSLAQLGLEPNTPLGHAYLIPRDSHKRGWEVTTIIGYQGYLELARRSGIVKTIYAHVVREGDHFEYELGIHKRLEHRPKAPLDAKITHVYSVAHIEGSEPLFEVLTFAEVEKRRKIGASGRGNSTPWDQHWEAMAKKSAIRAIWPWLPKSAEMAQAAEIDDEGGREIVIDSTPIAASAVDRLNAALAGETVEAQDDEVQP